MDIHSDGIDRNKEGCQTTHLVKHCGYTCPVIFILRLTLSKGVSLFPSLSLQLLEQYPFVSRLHGNMTNGSLGVI